jgi:hypothetical protein
MACGHERETFRQPRQARLGDRGAAHPQCRLSHQDESLRRVSASSKPARCSATGRRVGQGGVSEAYVTGFPPGRLGVPSRGTSALGLLPWWDASYAAKWAKTEFGGSAQGYDEFLRQKGGGHACDGSWAARAKR